MKKNRKRLLSLLLSLVLLLSLPMQALAAPCRDQGMMEAVVGEPLQHMLNLVFSAAMAEDVTALSEGETPSAAMQETLFSLFHYVEGSSENSVRLSAADADMLYGMFFASGAADAAFENGLSCDLGRFDEMPLAGAYVYESRVSEDANVLTLRCDLYTLWGYFSTPAQWVPEGDLSRRAARCRWISSRCTARYCSNSVSCGAVRSAAAVLGIQRVRYSGI